MSIPKSQGTGLVAGIWKSDSGQKKHHAQFITRTDYDLYLDTS
jgi:hypothetical protein